MQIGFWVTRAWHHLSPAVSIKHAVDGRGGNLHANPGTVDPTLGDARSSDSGEATAVIFDNGYAAGSVGLAGMASSQPSAMARSADVADLAVGGSIDVNGVAYLVAEIQPDGTGMVTLLLGKAAA